MVVDVATSDRTAIEGTVATTTGITASMPMMLTLVEAIAGRPKAEALAQELGLARWDARHASGAFRLTRPFVTTILANVLTFRARERVGFELHPGIDEVSLALSADAWSRTYRSTAMSVAASRETIVTRGGIRIHPDETLAAMPARQYRHRFEGQRPAQVLDQALLAIAARYGRDTADVVAVQLEYPR